MHSVPRGSLVFEQMTLQNSKYKSVKKYLHYMEPLKGHMVNQHEERRIGEPASHIFVIVAQKVSV